MQGGRSGAISSTQGRRAHEVALLGAEEVQVGLAAGFFAGVVPAQTSLAPSAVSSSLDSPHEGCLPQMWPNSLSPLPYSSGPGLPRPGLRVDDDRG